MRSGEYRSVDQSSVAGEDVGCFILDKKNNMSAESDVISYLLFILCLILIICEHSWS